MGASGVIMPLRVVVVLPPGQSVFAGPRLVGLKVLSDSLRRDPRVKDVRGIATVRRLSTLQLAMFYSDPAAVRAKFPEFFNAYLSADARTTLIDVIPADSVTFTGMMDVVRHARRVAAAGVRGLHGTEVLVGGFAAANVDVQKDMLRRLAPGVGVCFGITPLLSVTSLPSVFRAPPTVPLT